MKSADPGQDGGPAIIRAELQLTAHRRPWATGPLALGCLIGIGLLSGCTAGPDFIRPDAPATDAYTPTPLPARTVSSPVALGGSQQFVQGALVSGRWWHELGSPKLDALVDQALEASPTLEAAEATLSQALEKFAAQAGSSLYPQVDAKAGAQRQRFNPGTLGQPGDVRIFDLYDITIGVHYNLDLAGGNQRALEALAARADYQYFQLVGAQLTLVGSIAVTAITQAQLNEQLQATLAILQTQDDQVAITRRRLELGQASQGDLYALQTVAEQTRASIPVLRNQHQQTEHALAVLVGQAPGAGGLPTFALADFSLPAELPLVVPSELVRQRPDIQASEALLHAANAEYGVAVSRLYPQIALSANVGSQALSAASLFGGGSLVWGLAGQLTQPLFNPGLPAEKRAAMFAFDAAAANYRQTVLEALRNVADVLRALDNDAQGLASQAAADAAAQGSLQSMQHQYALGSISYLQLLAAQQLAQQTRIDLITAQARRLIDTSTLYQAMGGGEPHGEDRVEAPTRTSRLGH